MHAGLRIKKQEAYEIQGTKKNSEAVIQECLRYIHNHLEDTELSVNQLADQCHMNAIYLNRIFRKEKRKPVSDSILYRNGCIWRRAFF